MTLIELNIDKYHFEVVNLDYLIVADQNKLHEIEDVYAPKYTDLSQTQLSEITEMAADIEVLIRNVFPEFKTFSSKRTIPGFDEFREKYEISLPLAHRKIRRYLQGGRDMYALLDQRQNNKRADDLMMKTSTYEKNMHVAFMKFKTKRDINGRIQSVSAAYRELLEQYYSIPLYNEFGGLEGYQLFPEGEYPTETMFRRYVEKQLGEPIKKFKRPKGQKKNEKPRPGNAQTACPYPGFILEVDACELDIIIVSEVNKKHGIGKPVVYFAIDVFSCCITGFYVGFENNSFLGASALFANQFFGGEENFLEYQGKQYNVTPGGIVPTSIRVDQGSEWVSKDIRRFGREAGINIMIVAPGSGSLKGLVENSFHVYQEEVGNFGENVGAIYQAYESRHYDTAAMILTEIKQSIQNFIVKFNQQRRKKYDLSADMIKNKVNAVPFQLWDYGLQLCTPEYPTEAKAQKLLYALCLPCVGAMRVTLSLEGITIKDLKYFSKDPRFLALVDKKHFTKQSVEFEVRYDPRLVNYVWLKLDDEFLQVPLASLRDNQMSYKDMTWFAYNILYQFKKEGEKEYERRNMEANLTFLGKQKQLQQQALERRKAIPGKNDNKDIRAQRAIDQELERRRSALANQVSFPEPEAALPEPEPVIVEAAEVTESSPKKELSYFERFALEDKEE